MLYTPIHFAVFLIICFLLPTVLYSAYLLQTLYLVLGEAYIDVSISYEYPPPLLPFVLRSVESLCCV